MKKNLQLNEERNGGFKCCHCASFVPSSEFIGTEHRNHCPVCLWSKHVDLEKPGDRRAKCKAGMKPIALTFKREGSDKWRKPRQGELMLVHQCTGCKKTSINRIAADDNPHEIMTVFGNSKNLERDIINQLSQDGIEMLTEKDRPEILSQLFGKDFTNFIPPF